MNDKLIKYIKFAGTLLTLTAMLFIFKRLAGMDIDYSLFLEGCNLFCSAAMVIFNVFIIIFISIPWLCFVSIITQKKVPKIKAVYIYAKANIYKYIPGNVFQYVGRNELAVEIKASHVDIAVATVFDMIFNLLAPLILSALLMSGYVFKKIAEQKDELLIMSIAALLVVSAVTAVLFLKFRKKFSEHINRYIRLLTAKNIISLFFLLIYYIIYIVLYSSAYLFILIFMLGFEPDLSMAARLFGAFVVSWVIGYITPGAPGGIGIREAVMLILANDIISENSIILSMIILRFINIFADIFAFFFMFFVEKLYKRLQRKNIGEN